MCRAMAIASSVQWLISYRWANVAGAKWSAIRSAIAQGFLRDEAACAAVQGNSGDHKQLRQRAVDYMEVGSHC